jgi:hypothetical protein
VYVHQPPETRVVNVNSLSNEARDCRDTTIQATKELSTANSKIQQLKFFTPGPPSRSSLQ